MVKTNSTKKRLILYFLSVGVTAVWICLFILLFFLIYQNRYQQKLKQISDFGTYSDNLDKLFIDLDLYTYKEDEFYFEEGQEKMQLLLENINVIYEREAKASLRMELLEIQEMTCYLQDCVNDLDQSMKDYFSSGKKDFSVSDEKYMDSLKVIKAIQLRCSTVSHMLQTSAGDLYELTQRKTHLLILIFLLFFLLFGIVVYVHIRRISDTLTLPVAQLTQKAALVREGNLSSARELQITKQADLEITSLADVFDDMTLRLEDQFGTLKENARIRQELQISQFKELQMQINPHFMFNTLNMIAEKAYLENADETVELLQNAARMFRYSLDFSGKSVSLFKEIEELGVFVFLQEQRFGKRIRFIFDLEESFHDLKLPALTLQPLVENAIVHGIDVGTEQFLICIRTYLEKSGTVGCICVEDNGCGISQAKLAELRDLIAHYQGDSAKIGLGNVAMRIRYFFNGKAEFLIDSTVDKGTRVTMRIPLKQ